MSDIEHQAVYERGSGVWNIWRRDNPEIEPNLQGISLSGDLRDFDFSNTDLGTCLFYHVDLSGANLRGAKLHLTTMKGADFTGADLSGANLERSDLSRDDLLGTLVNFSATNLTQAILWASNLTGAILQGADLTGANLMLATLVEADLSDATLVNCEVFGASAWRLTTQGCKQERLRITPFNEPGVFVDDIEVAQFISLLLNNQKVRAAIDTITSKAVLILGRFTPERKTILDELRNELCRHDLVPILFDFEKPTGKNLTETISTLAHLARFVLADITDAKSIPQELQRIVPGNPSLPIQPLILDSQYEYSMFRDFLDYPWVLTPYRYQSIPELIASLESSVIGPPRQKADEIVERRKAAEKRLDR